MLKVIKSNTLFALVLLLSIPAYAAQPADSAQTVVKKTGWMSKLAAGAQGMFSRARQAMPSLQKIKDTGNSALDLTKRGFSAVGQKTADLSKQALNRALPVAQASLAFARRHPTAIKRAAVVIAVAGLGFAGYKAYKAFKAARVKHAPLFGQERSKPSTTETKKTDAVLMQEAIEAAKKDISALTAIYANRVEDADIYATLIGSFCNFLSHCQVPEFANGLKQEFVTLAQKKLEQMRNGLDEQAFTQAVAQLTELANKFDGLI